MRKLKLKLPHDFYNYYQYNYNYYQYKQTEIKLEFYLFREYLPKRFLTTTLTDFASLEGCARKR